jgi:hypothetical protein
MAHPYALEQLGDAVRVGADLGRRLQGLVDRQAQLVERLADLGDAGAGELVAPVGSLADQPQLRRAA